MAGCLATHKEEPGVDSEYLWFTATDARERERET